MVLIGYSGHAFAVAGILSCTANPATHYCDREEKLLNPFELSYLGDESGEHAQKVMKESGFFVAIGDNRLRKKIQVELGLHGIRASNAIHPSAIISSLATLGESGIMVSAGVIINPLARIGNGVICNTGCIIEHECLVGEYAHIGPGAVLCGNVEIGAGSFIGAGSVIRQGISIGENVMIGAGSVVVKDVPGNTVRMGNPAR